MGQAAKTGRSALPPPDLHPATCSQIESPGRRHKSLRIHDAEALQCKRLTRQMCGVALRRKPCAICAGVLPPVPRGQGDGRQGRASTRVDSRARALSRGSRRPRSPQQRTLEMGPTQRLRLPFSAIFCAFVPRGRGRRGLRSHQAEGREGQASATQWRAAGREPVFIHPAREK
jgi:hypothetical protein